MGTNKRVTGSRGKLEASYIATTSYTTLKSFEFKNNVLFGANIKKMKSKICKNPHKKDLKLFSYQQGKTQHQFNKCYSQIFLRDNLKGVYFTVKFI